MVEYRHENVSSVLWPNVWMLVQVNFHVNTSEELKGAGIHFTKEKKTGLSYSIFISPHHSVPWDQTPAMPSSRAAGRQGRVLLSWEL